MCGICFCVCEGSLALPQVRVVLLPLYLPPLYLSSLQLPRGGTCLRRNCRRCNCRCNCRRCNCRRCNRCAVARWSTWTSSPSTACTARTSTAWCAPAAAWRWVTLLYQWWLGCHMVARIGCVARSNQADAHPSHMQSVERHLFTAASGTVTQTLCLLRHARISR
jgi:hypothetical protein